MRFVHLTLANSAPSIRRTGLKASTTSHGPGVYAMPLLRDRWTTYQWARELRRWQQGQRIVAVTFQVPDRDAVWAGRYNEAPRSMTASESAAWVEANPHGAEVIVPGSVGVKAIQWIREIPQLVGWSETPESSEKWDCVCPACLPPGLPDLHRRLKGAFDRAIAALRQATTCNDKFQALQRMEEPAWRSRGRLSARRLLSQAQSPEALLRSELARLLGSFRWPEVEKTLLALCYDPDEMVRESAVHGVWAALGYTRAMESLAEHPEARKLLDDFENP